ncbi:hypothetical protein ACHAXA_000144 [Cyclostephanos tholiformis]|uniref:Homeobox domain-containing protein n=1 Tax=Cyclostephanos tholiformis TaxID=382380 RepID=A0ABD3SCB9_9STRA
MESSPTMNKRKTILTQVSTMSANCDSNDDRPSYDAPLCSADESALGPPVASTSPPASSASAMIADPNTKKISGIRPKNDKAVEVYKESTLVARFRTQTECARYLRATPEAVSYHCSRGGGVCNGLLVRPLPSSSSSSSSTGAVSNNNDDEGGNYFGLFEGSATHRPSARPQLSPEIVSLLKAWLLSPSHIDNPYPSGREYEVLMEMTKLDKLQLKHWFNNARKRILKPLLKNKDLKSSGRIGGASSLDLSAAKAKKKRKGGVDDFSSDGADAIAASKKAMAKRTMEAELMCSLANSSAHSSESGGMEKMNPNLYGLSQNQIILRQQQHNDADRQAASLLFQQDSNGSYGLGGQNINAMAGGRFDQLTGLNNLVGDMLFNATGNAIQNPMLGYGDIMGAGGFASVNRARGPQGMDSMTMDLSVNPLLRGYNQGMGEMFGRGGGLRGGPASYFGGGGMGAINGPSLSNLVAEDSSKTDSLFADEAARSNAMFKQQVAAMAMNEASVAFKEMEDAFAKAKAMVAQSLKRRRSDEIAGDDEDKLLLDANAHAKKCQSVAMFKLKVSQRASEEAAAAYSACTDSILQNNMF